MRDITFRYSPVVCHAVPWYLLEVSHHPFPFTRQHHVIEINLQKTLHIIT